MNHVHLMRCPKGQYILIPARVQVYKEKLKAVKKSHTLTCNLLKFLEHKIETLPKATYFPQYFKFQ